MKKNINPPRIINLFLLKLNFVKKIKKINIVNVFMKFDLSPIINEIKIKIKAKINIRSFLFIS